MKGLSKFAGGAIGAIKSVGNAVKSVVSGIGVVFQKIWKSSLGKIVLIAAALYLGGWALGFFNGPAALFSGGGLMATAAGPTATVVAGAGGATTTTVGGLAPVTVGGTGAAAAASGAVGAIGPAAGAAGTPTGGGLTASQAAPLQQYMGELNGGNLALGGGGTGGSIAGAAPVTVPAAAPAAAPGLTLGTPAAGTSALGDLGAWQAAAPSPLSAAGIVNTIKGLGGWVGDHQLISAVGLNSLATGLSQSPEEAAAEADADRRRRLNKNTMVGGIQVGAPSGQPLTDSYGKPVYNPATGYPTAAPLGPSPRGLINQRMG